MQLLALLVAIAFHVYGQILIEKTHHMKGYHCQAPAHGALGTPKNWTAGLNLTPGNMTHTCFDEQCLRVLVTCSGYGDVYIFHRENYAFGAIDGGIVASENGTLDEENSVSFRFDCGLFGWHPYSRKYSRPNLVGYNEIYCEVNSLTPTNST